MPEFGDIKTNTLANKAIVSADDGSAGAEEVITDSLEVGTPSTYAFPTALGLTGQILQLVSPTSLDWATGTSSGPGVVTVGSTDNETRLISGPSGVSQFTIDNTGQNITLGSDANPNYVTINGGVEFQYNEVSVAATFPNPATIPTYTMTDNDFMINVTDSSYTEVQLPQINPGGGLNRSGKMYVISRGYGGVGNLLVKPFAGDNIDGETVSVNIPDDGNRIQLIADGNNKWMII